MKLRHIIGTAKNSARRGGDVTVDLNRSGRGAGDSLRQTARNVPMIGFYGCTDTLVRVGWIREDRYSKAPQSVMADCPACGNRHKVGNFMFRKSKSPDEYALAMVHIEPSGDDHAT